MFLEMVVGSGAAFLAFLAWQGVNVTPVLALIALAVLLYYLLERRAEPVTSAAGVRSVPTKVTFEHIGGQGPAKKELKEALDFILRAEAVKAMGIRPLKGILLVGPPGTGKTLLAKAAASYTDAVFLAANGSEFVEVYAGVGAQRVRNLFRQARKLAARTGKNRAVVFIDEIDVLAAKRGTFQAHQEYDQMLTQLLVEMDGLRAEDRTQLLVIAASNRVDLLDPALLRPGRFDRVVRVDLPDRQGRLQILQLHSRNKPLSPEVDLEAIARETFGFSGAHLESVANEAAILALRQGSPVIEPRHFREAVDKVMLGEKLERKPTPEELYRIAVHESGHAVASELIFPQSVTQVTITSRGQALGYIRQTPGDDFYLLTKEYLEGRIQVLLGGLVAEETVLGSGSTGAAADLQEARRLAKEYVEAGLSDLGAVSLEDLPPVLKYRGLARVLEELKQRVAERLRPYGPALARLARELVREETLSGDHLRRLLRGESEEGSGA
ncbi:MAG: AAA family ATPase [Clostridia bacterium]|jgi:vesicle-fusing ATPase|nr:AAA family ATPase [Clostridia bacterium]MDH7572937.1 AAA family ATPase [Clostridia bacterium]